MNIINFFKKIYLYCVLSIFCIIFALIIFYINSITYPIINNFENKTKLNSFKEIIKDPENINFENIANNYLDKNSIIKEIYFGKGKYNNKIYYVLYIVSINGYSENIDYILTINKYDNTIENLKILKQNETPGLGANCINKDFQEKYKNINIKNKLSVVKNNAKKENNEIDAISSSTITTEAITKGVNIAIDHYNKNFKSLK